MISNVVIYNKIDRLRKAIRRGATPAIQEAWDSLEPHVLSFMNVGESHGTEREDAKDRSGSGYLGQAGTGEEVF